MTPLNMFRTGAGRRLLAATLSAVTLAALVSGQVFASMYRGG